MKTCHALLALFIVILVYQVRSGDLVEVKAQSSQLFVPFGETVWVKCFTPDPENTVYESRLQKLHTEKGPNWIAVEVRADDWESNTLVCLLDDSESETLVLAYALPSSVTIDMKTKLEEGKEYTITCTVYEVAPLEFLTIYITRGGEAINIKSYEGPHVKDRQTVSYSHTFTASRSDNSKDFSCETVLQLGPDHHTVSSSEVTVQTYDAVDTRQIVSTVFGIAGAIAIVFCIALCRWRRDGLSGLCIEPMPL